MFDFFDLMGGDDDGFVLIEIFLQQVLIKLLPVKNIEAQRRFIEYQQLGVNRHDQCQMQLHHHALRHLLYLHGLRELGVGDVSERFCAVEFRMHPRDKIDGIAHTQPTRQYRHVGNETNLLHERITLRARIESKHAECAVELCQTENRFESGRFARTIRPNQTDDATGCDVEIDMVDGDNFAVVFCKTFGCNDRAHLAPPTFAACISSFKFIPRR